jgi:hypothetical protein
MKRQGVEKGVEVEEDHFDHLGAEGKGLGR